MPRDAQGADDRDCGCRIRHRLNMLSIAYCSTHEVAPQAMILLRALVETHGYDLLRVSTADPSRCECGECDAARALLAEIEE